MGRFTTNTCTLLQYAQRMTPIAADVGGAWMRTARVLERRGFLTIVPSELTPGARKVHGVRLTPAGREAVAHPERAKRYRW
jgi:hypothetical protein